MTDAELAEIEKRAEAALPGPWRADEDAPGEWGVWALEAPRPTAALVGGTKADALFAAAARQDVPALLAEVRRLRQEIEAMRLQERADAEQAEYFRSLEDE